MGGDDSLAGGEIAPHVKAIDALSKLCDRLGMRPGKKPHLEGKHHHKKKAALKKVSVSNKEHLEDAEASHVDAERNEKDALKAVQNLIRLSTKMTKTGESFGKEHMKEISFSKEHMNVKPRPMPGSSMLSVK